MDGPMKYEDMLSLEERFAEAKRAGLKHHNGFELVLAELATLRITKVKEYGEKRYEETNEEFGLVMLFSDVYRKYIRVEHIIKHRLKNLVHETLRESFRDMANYCIMAVQMIDQWANRKIVPDEFARILLGDRGTTNIGIVTQALAFLRKTGGRSEGDHIIQQLVAALEQTPAAQLKVARNAAGEAVDVYRTVATISNAAQSALTGLLSDIGARIEQVAIKVRDVDATIKALQILGLTEWSHDTVGAKGYVRGASGSNTAHLAFNYQLGPFELELIQYMSGPNWLSGYDYGLSHLGVHVKDLGHPMKVMKDYGFSVAQQVSTFSHTNPKIKDSRSYTYVIFDTRDTFGFDLKLIQRHEVGDRNNAAQRTVERGKV